MFEMAAEDPGCGMSVTSPHGLAGPKGMEPEVVDILHHTSRKAFADEASQAIRKRWGLPDEYPGPREDLAFAREGMVHERGTVARPGISID